MKRELRNSVFLAIGLMTASCSTQSVVPEVNVYEQEALSKLEHIEQLMKQAESKGLDVTREESVVWFAEQFLKFANWDEDNYEAIEAAFGYERYYAPNKEQLAKELPDFERQKVIEILDDGIADLNKVISGEIKRRPVRKVDWQNTTAGDNMFVNGEGKPTFPYDYFSKTVGQPLGHPDIYNDHLGALYHGGENLYPVDHDRAINSFLVKEDGTFDEELLKELTDIPDDNIGYLVAWLMGIPEWVEAKEPEIRKGRALFQGFDLDNPLAREVWSKILRKSAEVTKGKKVIELGFVLANEPHWYAEKGHWTHNYEEMQGISSYTLAKFQAFLSETYDGDLASLNANWQSDFSSFDDVQIEIPIDSALIGTPKWYDWSRYNMHRTTEWFTFMQDELHAVNPEADTHIKIFPRTFYEDSRSHGLDIEALTELTTMIGHDAKAKGTKSIRPHVKNEWMEKYAYNWKGMGILHDFLESVGPDKINVNSESHFLSSGQWRELDTRTSYVRSVYWLATLMGMDANMGWFWARDPDGSPEDRLEGELDFFDPGLGGAYAGSNNMQPNVTNEVTQVMLDLNTFSEEIIALREQKRPLRIFYSETTAINTTDYMTKSNKFYEQFFFEGFPVGFATQNIIEKQDNANWDTIVVYNTPYATSGEVAALQAYLDQGGTIVVDSKESLSKNEYGQLHEQKLSTSNGKLIVLDEGSSIDEIREIALSEVADQMPDIIVSEDNGEDYKTNISRVVKQEDGSYLVNLLNVGKSTNKIKLTHKSGAELSIVDLMTAQKYEEEFELGSEEVLLIQVSVQ
ncbi:type 1 glutamine amidotransferase family protein [Hirschia maritima]|uniref:glycoside hydrolase family 42 n=1 Tax=Hirschia maritima TaxID=1121961 RepID=UPI0003AB462C|nr:glycoside hydrolase family 42 [Hirschia maritima]